MWILHIFSLLKFYLCNALIKKRIEFQILLFIVIVREFICLMIILALVEIPKLGYINCKSFRWVWWEDNLCYTIELLYVVISICGKWYCDCKISNTILDNGLITKLWSSYHKNNLCIHFYHSFLLFQPKISRRFF